MELALNASEKHNKKSAKELISLKISGIQMANEDYEQTPLQFLADKLVEDKEIQYVKLTQDSIPSTTHIDTTGYNSFYTKLREYPYEFEVNDSLKIASIQKATVSREEYNILQRQYNELMDEYNELLNRDLVFVSGTRNSLAIPEGVTKAYVMFADGTNDSMLTCNISGSIVKSSTRSSYATNVDKYTNNLRSTLTIYKVELTGSAGTINLSASGGRGAYRAWTATVAY